MVVWHVGEILREPVAQRVEAVLHQPDALEQARIDQGRNGFAILLDQGAGMPVLHQIEHLAQVLAEGDVQ